MTDVEYARKIAPEAFAEEDRVAAENAAVEARLSPKAAPEAAPSRWAMNVRGEHVRERPDLGGREFVKNRDGSVTVEFQPYKAPPVDQEASFAQTLISDMPDRFNKVLGHLAAGQIEEAEAERAEIKKFARENLEDLRAFSSYSGRDPVVRAAAERSMQLITGAWLPDQMAILFNPKANPAALKADLEKEGLPPEVLPYIENARAGDPAAIEIMDALGEKHLVNAPATRETAARRQAARAAADAVPGARRPVDPSEFLALQQDVENALGALPEDMRSVPALSGASAVRITRGLYAAGDIAAGAALRIGSRAVEGVKDMPPAEMAEVFKDVANKTAAAVAAFPDAGQRELAAAAFEELAGRGRQVGSQLPAVRESVARAMARADAFSAGSGAPMPREAFVKLAKAERHIASSTGSEPDADIRPVVSALSRATALKSNTTAVFTEFYEAAAHQELAQEEAQAVGAAQKTGQPMPPVVSLGHDLMRQAAALAFDNAATAAAANPSLIYKEALDAQAGPLAEAMLVVGAGSREEAFDAARLALRYLEHKGGGNLTSIVEDLRRDSEAVRQTLDEAEKPAEKTAEKTGEAPVIPPRYDLSATVAEAQLTGEAIAGGMETSSPDLEMFKVGRQLEPGKLTVLPYSGEFRQARALVRGAADKAAEKLFSIASPAVKQLARLRYSELQNPETLNAVADIVVAETRRPGQQRTFGVVPEETRKQIALDFVTGLAGRMSARLARIGMTESSYLSAVGSEPVDELAAAGVRQDRIVLGPTGAVALTETPGPGQFAGLRMTDAVLVGVFAGAGVPLRREVLREGLVPVEDKKVAGKLKQFFNQQFAVPAAAPAAAAPAETADPGALTAAGRPRAGGPPPPFDPPIGTDIPRAVAALARVSAKAASPVRDKGIQSLFSNLGTDLARQHGAGVAMSLQGDLANFVRENPKATLLAARNHVAARLAAYERKAAEEKAEATLALQTNLAQMKAEIKAMSEGGALTRPTAGE